MRRLLRVAAWAIAIGGAIDPAMALPGASRARLAIVVPQPSSAAAAAARDRVARDLSASYDIVPHLVTDAAAAIVIGERYPDEAVPDAMLVATVSASDPAPGVRIVGVDAPSAVPAATLIHLDVELEASLVAGQTTDVTASIAGLETARVSHRWTADHERWHASIDAIPVGEPPYTVRVRLPPSPGGFGGTGKPDTTETAPEPASVVSGFSRTVETTGIASDPDRTMADVVVDVRRTPLRVEFYDPRPSWATTFLRRALEADSRFQVATLSVTSRGIFAQTGGAVPPGDARLDAFDVVILGGLDRLSAAEASALDRYMRTRGGAVVVVPDQRIDAGPAHDLLSGGPPVRDPVSGSVRLSASAPTPSDGAAARPSRSAAREGWQPDLAERLLEQPATLTVASPAASLRASELLVMAAVATGSEVIARVPDPDPAKALPVIVSAPRGSGRLLLSGAMDAWRFRAADNAAFDRFWQSTIAGLALAVAPPIAIGIEPPLLRPGEPGALIVRVHPRDATAVSASIDGDQPIRLLPDAEAGVYRGRFVAKSTPGLSTVQVRAAAVQPLSASHRFVVSAGAARLPPSGAPLAMLASSHRGIDVSPDRIPELERFVRGAVTAPRTQQIRHPMRSAWWMLPFAVCLSAEWWMRRRKGQR